MHLNRYYFNDSHGELYRQFLSSETLPWSLSVCIRINKIMSPRCLELFGEREWSFVLKWLLLTSKTAIWEFRKNIFLLIATHKCQWEIALRDVTNGRLFINKPAIFFSFSICSLGEETRSSCYQDTGWDAMKGTKMILSKWLSSIRGMKWL